MDGILHLIKMVIIASELLPDISHEPCTVLSALSA